MANDRNDDQRNDQANPRDPEIHESSEPIDIFASFDFAETARSVVIEDDGVVAYAYLVEPPNGIIADVWLYNRCPTPSQPGWKTGGKPPFPNPAGYAADLETGLLPNDKSAFTVNMVEDEDGDLFYQIFLHGRLHAVITEDAKPGWCRLALKDGPVAQSLD